jgi:galactokinase
LLVRLAQKYFLGANGRLFGAKITGGGSGGAVAVLAIGEISDILKDILHDYYIETGINARVFQGSSPGALQFGVRKMTLR